VVILGPFDVFSNSDLKMEHDGIMMSCGYDIKETKDRCEKTISSHIRDILVPFEEESKYEIDSSSSSCSSSPGGADLNKQGLVFINEPNSASRDGTASHDKIKVVLAAWKLLDNCSHIVGTVDFSMNDILAAVEVPTTDANSSLLFDELGVLLTIILLRCGLFEQQEALINVLNWQSFAVSLLDVIGHHEANKFAIDEPFAETDLQLSSDVDRCNSLPNAAIVMRSNDSFTWAEEQRLHVLATLVDACQRLLAGLWTLGRYTPVDWGTAFVDAQITYNIHRELSVHIPCSQSILHRDHAILRNYLHLEPVAANASQICCFTGLKRREVPDEAPWCRVPDWLLSRNTFPLQLSCWREAAYRRKCICDANELLDEIIIPSPHDALAILTSTANAAVRTDSVVQGGTFALESVVLLLASVKLAAIESLLRSRKYQLLRLKQRAIMISFQDHAQYDFALASLSAELQHQLRELIGVDSRGSEYWLLRVQESVPHDGSVLGQHIHCYHGPGDEFTMVSTYMPRVWVHDRTTSQWATIDHIVSFIGQLRNSVHSCDQQLADKLINSVDFCRRRLHFHVHQELLKRYRSQRDRNSSRFAPIMGSNEGSNELWFQSIAARYQCLYEAWLTKRADANRDGSQHDDNKLPIFKRLRTICAHTQASLILMSLDRLSTADYDDGSDFVFDYSYYHVGHIAHGNTDPSMAPTRLPLHSSPSTSSFSSLSSSSSASSSSSSASLLATAGASKIRCMKLNAEFASVIRLLLNVLSRNARDEIISMLPTLSNLSIRGLTNEFVAVLDQCMRYLWSSIPHAFGAGFLIADCTELRPCLATTAHTLFVLDSTIDYEAVLNEGILRIGAAVPELNEAGTVTVPVAEPVSTSDLTCSARSSKRQSPQNRGSASKKKKKSEIAGEELAVGSLNRSSKPVEVYDLATGICAVMFIAGFISIVDHYRQSLETISLWKCSRKSNECLPKLYFCLLQRRCGCRVWPWLQILRDI
jgi:hypothetical protein